MADDAGSSADEATDRGGGAGRAGWSSLAGLIALLKNKRFMYTTLGASFNDVGSYVLMAFQATFYERVYHLDPSSYAPVLAVVLPLGGIIGGVGGGWVADGAASTGRRAWMTVGATALSAPFMLASLQAQDATSSFAALLVGFCLSEAWRAPSANMARGCAPPESGASTVSLYLCIRNLVGGLGPLGVALLAQQLDGDLRSAMLLVPAAYVASAALFAAAEAEFSGEQRAAAAALVQVAVPSAADTPSGALSSVELNGGGGGAAAARVTVCSRAAPR
uniref:Major facilitator superfamily (MFS) profile domain-containing protein n=1 Tax=Chlamydomonas euryale TaxID=1486919 RepID=A0A7R9V477_9CHLO